MSQSTRVAALVGGALGALVGWFALPSAFGLLSDNPNVVALGTAYSRWRFLGIASMAFIGGAAPGGDYVPSRVEDGRIVPGEVKPP